MYINKGGDTYGFCPAKANWDQDTRAIFDLLLVAAETGQLLYTGGILNQPNWFIEMLSWFAPRYDAMKFYSRMGNIFGGDSKKQMPKPKTKTKSRGR